MYKLFLGTSFSGHIDYETGQVEHEYKMHVEEILTALRSIDSITVFCAVEQEKWHIDSSDTPETGVKVDLIEIENSDVILALLPSGIISSGLQYEIGYAEAKGKQVVLASEVHEKLSYFNQGVVNLGRVLHVEFSSPLSLAEQVKAIFDKTKNIKKS